MHGTKQTAKTGFSKKRIDQLSKPKESKQEWGTEFDNWQLRWGDKDSMWQISKAAREAKAGDRIIQLSQPKKDFKNHEHEVHLYTYSCGRVSPLLEEEKQKIFKRHRKVETTSRINQLAQPKSLPAISGKLWTFSCGRESPIWQTKKPHVSRPSPADERLALPKLSHKEFYQNRELRADGRLSKKFMKNLKARGDTITTERLLQLSEPKMNKRNEANFFDERQPERGIRPVRRGTLQASASDRVVFLSKPNDQRYKDYKEDRFEWPVSRGALQYKISDRAEVLSKPVIRPSMEHTQYDPDAFFVKKAALKGQCSNRLRELSVPIQR